MPEAGRTILHYRLLELLGSGGAGVVWKARDTRLDRPVAVKLLADSITKDAAALARVEAEARVLAALNHPNIVTVYALEEAEGERFLAMELVEGRTLDELIPPGGLPLERLLELAVPVADALAGAHERGVTHRDLKPRNVMVGDDGRVKVLDFGLARHETRMVDISSSPTRTLQTGRLAGTLPYMSPEQVQGRELDPRSDLFSFGVLLYEMATGRRPFLGDSAGELIAAILRDTPERPSVRRVELPEELDQVVARCLEKDPRRRMQSSLDLKEELKALLHRAGGGERLPLASVAVLPFQDLSRERDQGYLCEGVAEEIIGTLARQPGLRVASRRSSFLYQGADLDPRELGRRLRAGALVEGSVRKEGTRLRIAASLTDATTGYQLWTERYDRELTDVFAIEEDIARGVGEALQVALAPSEPSAPPAAGTRDVAAYEYYLRGRSFYFQYRHTSIEFALELFSHALTRDPLYARAYAACADCCAYLYLYAGRNPAHRQRAELCSHRALELEPELAEAHASRGVVLSLQERDAEAEAAFEAAIRLNPRLFEAHYFYARHCFARGQLERAARLFEQAALAWPEDFQASLLVAQVYEARGRPKLAEAARRRGLAVAEERLRLAPDDARARYMSANALVALGERERGLDWARRALDADPEEPMTLYNVGCIRAMAGDPDGALDCLERAAGHGLTERGWFENDANLDPLRNLPRFQSLLASLPQPAPPPPRP